MLITTSMPAEDGDEGGCVGVVDFFDSDQVGIGELGGAGAAFAGEDYDRVLGVDESLDHLSA